MRIKKMIIKDKVTWIYASSPILYHKKYMNNSEEKMHADIGS